MRKITILEGLSMRYLQMPPSPAVQSVVRYFWMIEQDSEMVSAKYRLLAESLPNLVFFHRAEMSAIAGQTLTLKESHITGPFLMFGVCLYPYALPVLFKIAASELTDSFLDFELLKGNEGRRLKEQVIQAKDFEAKVEIVTNFFLSELKFASLTKRSIHGCVQQIVNQGGLSSVGHIVDELGLSARQIERKFQESVGFSPKVFGRVVRFHHALKFAGSGYSLTRIAHEAGYFDQSHFIREFNEFSGMSPKHYFQCDKSQIADNFILLSQSV